MKLIPRCESKTVEACDWPKYYLVGSITAYCRSRVGGRNYIQCDVILFPLSCKISHVFANFSSSTMPWIFYLEIQMTSFLVKIGLHNYWYLSLNLLASSSVAILTGASSSLFIFSFKLSTNSRFSISWSAYTTFCRAKACNIAPLYPCLFECVNKAVNLAS